MKYLDPTIDIVFKLLLLHNQELLRDMIEAVLDLRIPIAALEVLNPELPGEFPEDKAVILDVRVRLRDGKQIDLEMQSSVRPSTRGRFLYYWAKGFTDALAEGDDYDELPPCISILWFKKRVLQTPRFHSVFHLAEDHSQEVFAEEIEFHVLELTNLHLADTTRQVKLARWARFLRAESPEQLEELAQEDAIMTSARDALSELSMDPKARRLAAERETAGLIHRYLLKASYKDGLRKGEARGRAEGRAEGRVEGRVEGTDVAIAAVRALCAVLGLDLTDARLEQLMTLNHDQLKKFLEFVATERRWPE